MKNIYLSILLLLVGSVVFSQTLSLYSETGSESDGKQYVYVYGENLTNADQAIGGMTLLVAHQSHQAWQSASSWSLASVKWDATFARQEDIAHATGYGSGFSHLFRSALAAGPDDDPIHIAPHTKILLARIAFTASLLGEEIYLVGPLEDQMVSMADQNGDPINFIVTGQPVIAGLPVELVEFKAEQIGERLAEVRWTSQIESQTEAYIVEKSIDGQVFEVLAEEAATGPGAYQVQDENPFLPITHYRLRWRDTDGETGLTETVQVQFTQPGTALDVFPNPTSGKFQVRFGEKLDVLQELTLVNAAGKTIWQRKSLPSVFILSIDLSGIPAGLYWMRGTGFNGESIATSLVIQ